jgi:hypothetical protein
MYAGNSWDLVCGSLSAGVRISTNVDFPVMVMLCMKHFELPL